jgi:hypothetical protein
MLISSPHPVTLEHSPGSVNAPGAKDGQGAKVRQGVGLDSQPWRAASVPATDCRTATHSGLKVARMSSGRAARPQGVEGQGSLQRQDPGKLGKGLRTLRVQKDQGMAPKQCWDRAGKCGSQKLCTTGKV